MSVLSLLLATAAFVLLGLATDAHHRRRFGACPQRRRRTFRTGGWLALIASVVPAMLARGWIFGPILWVGSIMAGAGIAFLALNFIPARDARR
ncbi:DUF3325 family protein [Sphingomonas sp. ZB1N12]|jgi:hypothetical protein|uniref:DUF3325 family protein n=1 Tax=Sphingomonas arabinosi TaxID=3096160 RepID=UPI002FC7B3E9